MVEPVSMKTVRAPRAVTSSRIEVFVAWKYAFVRTSTSPFTRESIRVQDLLAATTTS